MLTAPPRPAGRPRTPPPAPAPSQGEAPGAASRRAARPGATFALAVVTVASAAGLFRVFSGRGWVAPVLVTIAAIHLSGWTLRRRGVGQAAAAVVAALGIVLMTCWTVLGRYTVSGIPTSGTWDHAVSALRQLSSEISSLVAPVPLTRAFELLAVAGAGLAAAIADWAAFRWRMPLLAVVPGLAVFIFCCTSGSGRGRGTVVGLEVAAICLFLLVERATVLDGQIWFAGIRAGVGPWVAATGGVVAAVAVIAAVSLSPALPRRDGAGVLGWRSGLGANGGERIVPNPLVDLRTQLTRYANIPAFVVSSTAPSYWRLTSLDTFDGSTWTSTGSYRGFGTRLPGAPPAGVAVRTARATFQIQQLDSVWLPAQFDPLSVQGVRRVTYDPGSNSLLTSATTTPGLSYSVISYQYLDTLSAAALAAAAPDPKDPVVDANLALPQSVYGPVTSLAQRITAGLPTEYAKAAAIQAFLRGRQFSYSLNPPSDGSSNQALYNFLFVTRSGYCQQFAGAFAVLARAAGLPTRLAVGFVTGDQIGGGGYQVHDRDSHTWPEVYFGPRYGWVPFEPTPGFSVPGTSGYSSTSGTPSGPQSPVPTTVPTTAGGDTGPTTPLSVKPARGPVGSAPQSAVTVRHPTGVSAWWLALPAVVVLWLAGNGLGPLLLRRIRRHRAARAGPRAVVLNAWSEVTSELLWQGIARTPDETDDEFARRASRSLRRRGIDTAWEFGGLEALGALARRAGFAASVPEGIGEQATASAEEIERKLAWITPGRQRLTRLWTPRPGMWAALADAVAPPGRRAGRERVA